MEQPTSAGHNPTGDRLRRPARRSAARGSGLPSPRRCGRSQFHEGTVDCAGEVDLGRDVSNSSPRH